MKIRQVTAGSGDRQKFFLSAGMDSGIFAIFQHNQATHALSGYVGSMKRDGIASVKPVRYNTRGLEISDEVLSALNSVLLAKGAGLKVSNPFARRDTLESQASAWMTFMNKSKPQIERGPDEDELTIPPESMSLLTGYLNLIRRTGEDISIRRSPNFSIGMPVDGFAALTIQKSAARVFNEIAIPKDLDLDRASRALCATTRPSSHAVAWYGVSDPELGKLRLQAAESYPVLAGMIADSITLARKVDAMESISEAMTARTGLPKAALKRIGKLREKLADGPIFEAGEEIRGEDALGIDRARRTSVRGALSLEACLAPLATMQADRTPANDDDWSAYSQILPGCVTPIANAFNIAPERILDASKGNWSNWKDTLARSADFDPEMFDRRQIALATIDALEAVDDFSRTVILPLVLRSIESTGQEIPPQTQEYMRAAAEAAGEIILGKSKSIASSLLEIGRRYASRIPSLMNIEGSIVDEGSGRTVDRWARYGPEEFPVLMDEFRASNGLVVRPLRNHEEMREESRRLTNCIGRLYLSQATQTTSHFFAVQNASNTKSYGDIQMIGINVDLDRNEMLASLHFPQFRAQRNGVPEPEAQLAYEEWRRELQAGNFDLNIDEIRDWRQYLLTQSRTHAQFRPVTLNWNGALGTDWKDPEKISSYWNEWSEIMPRSAVSGPVPEALFRHAPIRRLVEEMSPAAATILRQRAEEAANPSREEMDTPVLD